MSKKIQVTINNEALAKANGVKKGGSVTVEMRDGVPVERYWRNRFKDAEIDSCVSLPSNKSAVKPKESTKPGDK